MSTYVSTTAPIWCRVGGYDTPIFAGSEEMNKVFVHGGGFSWDGILEATELPPEMEEGIVGGGYPVPMAPKDVLAHQEYTLLCGGSGFMTPEAREKATQEAQEWVSALEDAIGRGYEGNVPSSVAEFRQWMAQWEANGRPCQCGSGGTVAMCPETSPYCG